MADDDTVLTNRTRAWGFIQSEANFWRSRDRVTLDGSSAHLLGETVYAGTVLAEITATGLFVPAVKTAADGSQTAQVILGEDAQNISGDLVVAVFARDGEVRAEDLTYDDSIVTDSDQAAVWAQLAAAYPNGNGRIIVREMGGVQADQSS
jgi:hypothetical protein